MSARRFIQSKVIAIVMAITWFPYIEIQPLYKEGETSLFRHFKFSTQILRGVVNIFTRDYVGNSTLIGYNCTTADLIFEKDASVFQSTLFLTKFSLLLVCRNWYRARLLDHRPLDLRGLTNSTLTLQPISDVNKKAWRYHAS